MNTQTYDELEIEYDTYVKDCIRQDIPHLDAKQWLMHKMQGNTKPVKAESVPVEQSVNPEVTKRFHAIMRPNLTQLNLHKRIQVIKQYTERE